MKIQQKEKKNPFYTLILTKKSALFTLFKFFKVSVIYCSAIFPPDLALILIEYT